MFAEYLKLLDEGKVNRNLSTGNPEFDPKEYSENLKNDMGKKNMNIISHL